MKKDKIIRYVYGFIFITIVIGLGDMPYAYYQFLRWAVSVSLLFLIFNAHKQSDELTKTEKKDGVIATCFFGIIVILFNPIFPIHLNLVIWKIIDVVVLLGLFVILYREKEIKEKESRKGRLLLLNKILSSIKNGNKAEKVDGLTKLSKILKGGEYKEDVRIDIDLEEKIDLTTRDLNLEGVNLSNSRFEYIDLSGSNLRNANLEKSVFLNINMSRVDLENANLKNSKLTFSVVGGANLKNADLEGAYLFGVKFKNTNLLGANLRGANLQRADISDSLIKLSDLDSEDSLINKYIEEKKLTPPDFKNATYDCETKFPKDFNPEKERMIEVDMYTHKKI